MRLTVSAALAADPPARRAGQVIQVDGSTPLGEGLDRVLRAATSSPVELVIACHGYMTHEYERATRHEGWGRVATM